jgi:hypothetical protein
MPTTTYAGFPTAEGVTSYHGTYIPDVWSKRLLLKFYEGTCLREISQTNYEGEIKNMGDRVVIRTVADIEIRDYEKGQSLRVQTPSSATDELTIDQGKYFNYQLNDVDRTQSDLALLDQWATDRSNKMKIAIERDVFADVYADADSDNKGNTAGALSSGYDLGSTSTPLGLTRENVLDLFADVNSVLSEQDIPEDDRWIVIPVWMANLIKKSDLKDASLTGDGQSVLRTGRIGMIDGMKIFRSNLLTNVTADSKTCTHIMAGHKCAISFATQLVKNEELRNPDDFGDLHRGLQIFGYKALQTTALVDVLAYKAA